MAPGVLRLIGAAAAAAFNTVHFCTGESNGSDAAWNPGSSQVTANSLACLRSVTWHPRGATGSCRHCLGSSFPSYSWRGCWGVGGQNAKNKTAKQIKPVQPRVDIDAITRSNSDRSSNNCQFGLAANRNGSSSTCVHAVFPTRPWVSPNSPEYELHNRELVTEADCWR